MLLVLVLGVFALDWTMTEMSNWRRDFDRREELRQRDFYREIDRVVEEIESSSLAAPAVSEQVSE